MSMRRLRVACCSRKTVSGSKRCGSPSRRHWYSPPPGRPRCAGAMPDGGQAVARRAATSAASTGRPTPWSRAGAAVGGHRGDAHLAHHLEHALAERADDVAHRLLGGDAGDGAGVDELLGALHGEVGVDGGRTVPDEEGDVVDLADVPGLDEEAD